MIKGQFPISQFENLRTPFYYYDMEILRNTLQTINTQMANDNYVVHYAVKANANPKLLKEIQSAGMGADCVSGGEIKASLEAGFPASKIVFAGVGKADWEIKLALENDISCFNVESVPELEVINELAGLEQKTAKVALRINPNVDAHTHHNITTGLNENKFGINMNDLDKVIALCQSSKNVELVGIHFHIGSQITDTVPFQKLCTRINELQKTFEEKGITLDHINVGGGLGINYEDPNLFSIPEFSTYFTTFRKHLKLRANQTLHFELGRSVTAQCGNLVSRILYIKSGENKQFAILDAGFTELIRPVLYDASHRIENVSSDLPEKEYDIVGPICESSDTFAKSYPLNEAKRGDFIAIRSAGAYGEIMASSYNLRELPKSYTSDELSQK